MLTPSGVLGNGSTLCGSGGTMERLPWNGFTVSGSWAALALPEAAMG